MRKAKLIILLVSSCLGLNCGLPEGLLPDVLAALEVMLDGRYSQIQLFSGKKVVAGNLKKLRKGTD